MQEDLLGVSEAAEILSQRIGIRVTGAQVSSLIWRGLVDVNSLKEVPGRKLIRCSAIHEVERSIREHDRRLKPKAMAGRQLACQN